MAVITESISSLITSFADEGALYQSNLESAIGLTPGSYSRSIYIQNNASSTSTGWVSYRFSFDTSIIPQNATISKVECTVGGCVSPISYVKSFTAQLFLQSGGQQLLGEAVDLRSASQNNTVTFDIGQWYWDASDLNLLGITYNLANSKAYKCKGFITGAKITVTYTYQNEHFMLKSGGAWGEVSKVFKKISGAWVEQTALTGLISSDAMLVKGAGLSFLYTDPIVPFTLANVHIPGVVYSSSTGYYYSVGSSSTSLIDDCYYYMLNSSLTQARSDTITFNSTALFSHYPSSIELHQNGYIFVGFNGNDQDVTLNRSIFRTTPATSTSASISGNTGWRNNDTQYQVNASAVSSAGNVVFFGNYNNDSESGSAYYTSAYTSAGTEPTIYTLGLGNVSGQSPFISATTYVGYPCALTRGTTLVRPVATNDYSSWKYHQINSAEEGISISVAGDYLIICTKTSAGTYKIYYSNAKDPINMTASSFSSATVSKALKSVFQLGTLFLLVYEDGTVGVRTVLNGDDIFNRALTSYSNVSIRDVRILNGKLIFTGWYGTNQANSFVGYYDVSAYV